MYELIMFIAVIDSFLALVYGQWRIAAFTAVLCLGMLCEHKCILDSEIILKRSTAYFALAFEVSTATRILWDEFLTASTLRNFMYAAVVCVAFLTITVLGFVNLFCSISLSRKEVG